MKKILILLVLLTGMMFGQVSTLVGYANASALKQRLDSVITLNTRMLAVESNKVAFSDSNGANGWYKRTYVDALLSAKQNSLGYNPVTTARTLTINGTSYDLSANRSWTIVTAGLDTTGLWAQVNAIVEGLPSSTLLASAETLDSLTRAFWLGTLAGGATTLDGLTDVVITTPSSSQALTYNGSGWVNSTLTGSLTAAQLDQIDKIVVYLALDTTSTMQEFSSEANARVSSQYTSNKIAIDSNMVVKVAVDSGEYKVYYDSLGTHKWNTNWQTATRNYRDVDSAIVQHYTGATNSYSYNQRLFVAGDTSTFSVTTEASGSFIPSDLNPVFDIGYNNDTMVVSGSKTFVSITSKGWTIADDDTTTAPLLTDSSIYFGASGTRRLVKSDETGNPFDFRQNDFTIECWVNLNDATGIIASKNDGTGGWILQVTQAAEKVLSFSLYSAAGDTLAEIKTPDVSGLIGTTHHFQVSLDRNVGAIMWQDGTVVTTENTSEWTNLYATDVNDTGYFRVGRSDLGHLFRLRLFWSALTDDNNQNLFDYGKVGNE